MIFVLRDLIERERDEEEPNKKSNRKGFVLMMSEIIIKCNAFIQKRRKGNNKHVDDGELVN